ncbi:MAG TPA: GDSL-type esterase/lipase family protein [Dinghuibacter sp.]|uniref:GDSL-type esterase/lipase family protein n=1 Tax=Dinghuibacter sp. TaxID=2024697 RepID=UPI002C2524B6|nr:GDSL-type esterase/lipase family protein [Dinghuibacter sp.]HTJ11558.1 GDSL-type esterase/lipase family protein [Dinghuibacter sp.]
MRYLTIAFLALAHTVLGQPLTRVTCIGTSITYGARVDNREKEAYPAQLEALLGAQYRVSNFGASGTTLLHKGNSPYWATGEYQKALDSHPQLVLMEFGTNDSKGVNRAHLDEFAEDYKEMIRSFTQLPSHPRVVLLLPIPSFAADSSGIWDPVITGQIIPAIREVAYEENLEVIDMHSLLADKEALLPDKVHPGAEGYTVMAKRLYDLIVQKKDRTFDVFAAMRGTVRTESSFYGYRMADFMLDGVACKVVKPKWAAPGHPWVWRARFWGHEPQADIALLEHGFHIVYCDVVELFGNSEAIERWDRFYAFFRKAGLSKKAVMEGMSRGGVYVFNWAAVNPDKVACVYVDNPVLDLKSWPGGKGVGPGSPDDWVIFKKDYGYTTEEQAMTFAGSPINKVAQIVKGRYPILILCADADEAVPPGENTLPFEQKVKALGGNITVYHKPGFHHHPHSLPNPAYIVDFILRATGYFKGL